MARPVMRHMSGRLKSVPQESCFDQNSLNLLKKCSKNKIINDMVGATTVTSKYLSLTPWAGVYTSFETFSSNVCR